MSEILIIRHKDLYGACRFMISADANDDRTEQQKNAEPSTVSHVRARLARCFRPGAEFWVRKLDGSITFLTPESVISITKARAAAGRIETDLP